MSQKRLVDRIARRARSAGIDPSSVVLGSLAQYFSELAKWNRKINLTALAVDGDGSDEAVDRLLIEPLLACKFLPPTSGRLLDVGSGGGSPAIPIRIVRPDLTLTMVEVKVRKSAFLRQVSRHLQHSGTTVETCRFEQLLASPQLHEAFDVVTVRAVKVDKSMLLNLQAFLRPEGLLLNFTTGDVVEPQPPLVLRDLVALVPENLSRLAIFAKRQVGPRFT